MSIPGVHAADFLAPLGVLSGFAALLGLFPAIFGSIGAVLACLYYGLAILNDARVQHCLDRRRKAKIEKYRKKISTLQASLAQADKGAEKHP